MEKKVVSAELKKVKEIKNTSRVEVNEEIEKKYILAGLPEIVKERNVYTKIEQTYLDFKGDKVVQEKIKKIFGDLDLKGIAEARIRLKEKHNGKTKCVFTLKSDGTLSRKEYEEEISKKLFAELQQCASLGKVNKVRYEDEIVVKGVNLTVEIDVYDGNLEGLYSAEIEMPADLVKHGFDKILAKRYGDNSLLDVTEDKFYKNKNLAKIEDNNLIKHKIKAVRLGNKAD